MEKEDEEVRDLVRCHPMPSPDDKEDEQFWKKVIDRMKEAEGVNAMIIYSFVRFDIMKKLYENLTDNKMEATNPNVFTFLGYECKPLQ